MAEDKDAVSQDYSQDIKKAEKSKDGWIQLFNGKDLTGWRISDNGKWKVEEGEIVANGPRSHLFTDQEFKNFILQGRGQNHARQQFRNLLPHEVPGNRLAGKRPRSPGQREPHRPGQNRQPVQRRQTLQTPAKDNEWWTQTVIVKGRHIIIKVNNEVVVNYTEPQNVKGGRKLSQGSFALQAHDPKSVVYYRNIRVKRLPD